MCDTYYAMFILDLKRKLAWAVEGEEENVGQKSARVWGIVNKKDEFVLKEIVGWLASHEIPLVSITHVSLPESVSRSYEAHGGGDVDASAVLDSSGKVNISNDASSTRTHPLAPVELFRLLAPSIYVVHATQMNGDEFQGSAVAISSSVLLTNCHVVNGAPSITMTQANVSVGVSLISANVDADRCVLKSGAPLGNYVSVRQYNDLKIGERVYSIGAPAGLELTMTDGLVSGKRPISGQNYIQTSAPISPGSSGGGLFDEAGNLIGVTTFRLKDSENLNFAISAEEYLLH
jgi:S1-C subfamily serine protease